jgi:hypothetical protein
MIDKTYIGGLDDGALPVAHQRTMSDERAGAAYEGID